MIHPSISSQVMQGSKPFMLNCRRRGWQWRSLDHPQYVHSLVTRKGPSYPFWTKVKRRTFYDARTINFWSQQINAAFSGWTLSRFAIIAVACTNNTRAVLPTSIDSNGLMSILLTACNRRTVRLTTDCTLHFPPGNVIQYIYRQPSEMIFLTTFILSR